MSKLTINGSDSTAIAGAAITAAKQMVASGVTSSELRFVRSNLLAYETKMLLNSAGTSGLNSVSETATNLAAPVSETEIPAKSTAQITGAFGWTLGEKLPNNCEMTSVDSQGLCFFDNINNTNTPPFYGVKVWCLKDRTICVIQATADSDYRTTVLRALTSKYGQGTLSDKGRLLFWDWYVGDCVLEFKDAGVIFTVQYENTKLKNRPRVEFEMQRDEEIKNVSSNLNHNL